MGTIRGRVGITLEDWDWSDNKGMDGRTVMF